jgi:hypothetical protein
MRFHALGRVSYRRLARFRCQLGGSLQAKPATFFVTKNSMSQSWRACESNLQYFLSVSDPVCLIDSSVSFDK